MLFRNLRELVSQPQHYRVTLLAAIFLTDKVDTDFRQMGDCRR